MKLAPMIAAAVAVLAAVSRVHGAPIATPHVVSQLVSEARAVTPGSSVRLALAQSLDPGWHTYWRNPGDAGEATQIAWSLPRGWRAGSIIWPAPSRFPLGPIMNYGYQGRVLLPTVVTVPASAKPGAVAHVVARAQYLVCAEVCIPGAADLAIDLPVVAAGARADPRWGPAIAAAVTSAPRRARGEARFQLLSGKLILAVTDPKLANAADAYFFPYRGDVIDQAAAQAVDRGRSGVTLTLSPGPAFAKSPVPLQLEGVIESGGAGLEIAAVRGPAPGGAAGFGAPRSPRDSGGGSAPGSWLLAMLGAFTGGLILNLMPCVFPILAMKAAALADNSLGGATRRVEGLAFLAGVLASFLTLAGVLLTARAAGEAVGWGFQLQNPVVVAILALVMLAAGLDLSGVFEIGGAVQGLGPTGRGGGSVGQAALTGALAVVVAAPCTAPFMGPALGLALTESPAVALTIFLAVGLGFAAPFTILATSPALARRLPRPGPWMDIFRKVLAFPMYAAAAWLAWVLAQQDGSTGLAALFAAALALALAAWLFGLAQRGAASGRARVAYAACAVSALASLGGIAAVAAAPVGERVEPSTGGTLPTEPYSSSRLAALRDAGRPVFVNFTAAWCVTCQVNDRVAFSSPAVVDAFRRTGAGYLLADWTRRDPVIARALADQNRIGVPLYLVYRPGEARPRVLPQLLTPAMVATAIEPPAA